MAYLWLKHTGLELFLKQFILHVSNFFLASESPELHFLEKLLKTLIFTTIDYLLGKSYFWTKRRLYIVWILNRLYISQFSLQLLSFLLFIG